MGDHSRNWGRCRCRGCSEDAPEQSDPPSGRKGCPPNGGCGLEGFRQHFQQDGFHGYVKNSREAEASRVIFALFSLILLAQQIQLPPE